VRRRSTLKELIDKRRDDGLLLQEDELSHIRTVRRISEIGAALRSSNHK
jgi:hypothetical protein